MSAYTSKLKGWGLDRAIAMKQAGFDIVDIKATAEMLAEWAHDHEEDLVSAATTLYEILKHAPDGQAHFDEIEMSIAAIKAERAKDGLDQPKVELNG